MITVSIVSHGQGHLVERLLGDLVQCKEIERIVITENVPESPIAIPETLSSKIVHLKNSNPLGFGANHNQAFKQCETPFFCVVNPDIRIAINPFPPLIAALEGPTALSAPAVVNALGKVEDSARRFPTPLSLLRKVLGQDDSVYRYTLGDPPFSPDWVAGMFMLFPAQEFSRLGGFDHGYFLYYEDVDICARIKKASGRVVLEPGAVVCHEAQRTSRKNLRYMTWHAASLMRYLRIHWL